MQEFKTTTLAKDETVKYTTSAIKYDRKQYKPRDRVMIVTNKAIYLLEVKKTFKVKHKLPLNVLEFVVTSENDGLLLIKIPPELKKDKVIIKEN